MLSINIFTEKIYVILWFWFVILSVVTFFDLIFFMIKNMFASQRYFYVKKHVVIFSSLQPPLPPRSTTTATTKKDSKPRPSQLRALNEFSNKFLKPDIVLVLKIIAANVNGLVVSELIKYLWEAFLRSKPNDYDDDLRRQDDDDYLNEKEMQEEDDDDEDEGRTASFPLNRQSASSEPPNRPPPPPPPSHTDKNNNGPVKRLLGFRTSPKDAQSANVDDRKPPSVGPSTSDAVNTIKATNMPTSSATTSIV